MAKYIKLEELMRFPIRRNHYDKEHGSKDFIYGIETVLEYAENLQTTDVAQEWISVEDRLPEKDEIVIICTNENFIYAGELIGDTWFLDNDSWTATVTHWMPLPEPPKGE